MYNFGRILTMLISSVHYYGHKVYNIMWNVHSTHNAKLLCTICFLMSLTWYFYPNLYMYFLNTRQPLQCNVHIIVPKNWGFFFFQFQNIDVIILQITFESHENKNWQNIYMYILYHLHYLLNQKVQAWRGVFTLCMTTIRFTCIWPCQIFRTITFCGMGH